MTVRRRSLRAEAEMGLLGVKRAKSARAETIRQRRQDRMTRVSFQSRVAAFPSTWEPKRRRPGARARRRYDIALGQPGVEVSLPSVPFALTPRSAAVALALVCAGCVLFLVTAGGFSARPPKVEGNHFLPASAITEAARVEGLNVFLLSPARVSADAVAGEPGLQEVHVSVSWPDQVTLRVEERAPLLAWNQAGSTYWVDAQGVFFPAPGSLDGLVNVEVPEAGPMVRLDSRPSVSPSIVAGALELMAMLPDAGHVVYDVQRGLGVADPRGWPVYFGQASDVPAKVDLYQRVVSDLLSRGIRPGLVSVEDTRQPYYRH